MITQKTEVFIGLLTMASTFLTADILVDLIVGVSVYFASRLLYKHYGKKVDAFFMKLKKHFKN